MTDKKIKTFSWQKKILWFSSTLVIGGVFFVSPVAYATSYTIACSGTAAAPTAVNESRYGSSDELIFNGAGYCVLDAVVTAQTVIVEKGVTITHPAEQIIGVAITATTIHIQNGASINVSGKGCRGANSSVAYGQVTSGNTPGNCVSNGSGAGQSVYGLAGSGGGHGGRGGNGSDGALGGDRFDTFVLGKYLGSGGGRDANEMNIGGNGGGLVNLQATTLTIDGTVVADGTAGTVSATSAAGGGAGGTIYLHTSTIDGAGNLSAGGGAGGDGIQKDGGGGGGGSIIVKYTIAQNTATVLSSALVTGGQASSSDQFGNDGKVNSTSLLPVTPIVTSPIDASFNVSLNPTLTASTYTATSGSHVSSDWKISSDVEGDKVVWSASSTASDKTSILVKTMLAADTSYYAFVRYTNASGNSPWSAPTMFTTLYTGNTTSHTWDFSESNFSQVYSFNDLTTEVNTADGGLVRLKDQGNGTYPIVSGLTNWTKRQRITITNSNVSASNYQIRIPVTYVSEMRTDFGDVRFTLGDGRTLLPHWLETKTDGKSAVFWIKLPMLTSGASTVYLYYGNDSAVTTSDASAVFIFGDDFTEERNAEWLEITSGGAATGTITNGTWTKNCDGECAVSTTSGLNAGIITSLPVNETGWEAITKISGTVGSGSTRQVGMMLYESPTDMYLWGNYPGNFSGTVATNTGLSVCTASVGVPLYLKISKTTSNGYTFSYSTNGSSWKSCGSVNDNTISKYGLFVRDTATGITAASFDFFVVRKYISTEPTVSFGVAQSLVNDETVRIIPALDGNHPRSTHLVSFSEVLAEGNQGSVLYQLGVDGDNDGMLESDNDSESDGWYYVSNGRWKRAQLGIEHSTTATIMNSFLPIFSSEVGMGSVYFKAVFVSRGNQPVQLDRLILHYRVAPLPHGALPEQKVAQGEVISHAFDLSSYFTDPEDVLTYTIVDDLDPHLGGMTLDSSGKVSFAFTENNVGTDTIQFRATDEEGFSTMTNSIVVTVNERAKQESVATTKNAAPTLIKALPNVTLVSGGRNIPLFDLDEYFSDDRTTDLRYTVTESVVTMDISDGKVVASIPDNTTDSLAITFTATDTEGVSTQSNVVIVSIAERTSTTHTISAVKGSAKGKGVIQIYNQNGEMTASWEAFTEGGVIPRIVTIADTAYVLAVKRRAGSTIHVYTLDGTVVLKKRLSPKLHWRRLLLGNLDNDDTTQEIVVSTLHNNAAHVKVFRFDPTQPALQLVQWKKYRSITNNKYSVRLKNKSIRVTSLH